MKTSEQILAKAGEEFVKRLRQQFADLGLNDTHAAEQSLSSSVQNNKLIIEGKLRTVVLVTGRKPGKFPPIKPIREWAIRKLGVSEDEADSVAFLIARKIAKKGTDIFTGKSKGLQIELIIDELNKELEQEVNTQVALSVTESVIESYQ